MKKKSEGLKINLVDGWKILSDTYNIILQSPGGRQFYYSNVHCAIESLIDKRIKSSEATSIEMLIQEIKCISDGLNKVLQPLKMRVVGVDKSSIQTKLGDKHDTKT